MNKKEFRQLFEGDLKRYGKMGGVKILFFGPKRLNILLL